MKRRLTRLLSVLIGATLLLPLAPSVAHATIDGPCEGTYTLQNGDVLDGDAAVIEVDREALNPPGRYFGRHTTATPGEGRSHGGGFVKGDLPGPDITFGTWDPVDETEEVEKSDTYDPLDLIDRLPPIKVRVYGQHQDSAGDCEGEVVLVFKGEGPFDTIYWVVVIVLAVVLLAVILLLSRRSPQSTGGRRFLKAIIGLLLAILLAIMVVFLILLGCWANTGDDWLLILMIVIVVLGFVLPLWSPFGARRAEEAAKEPDGDAEGDDQQSGD